MYSLHAKVSFKYYVGTIILIVGADYPSIFSMANRTTKSQAS